MIRIQKRRGEERRGEEKIDLQGGNGQFLMQSNAKVNFNFSTMLFEMLNCQQKSSALGVSNRPRHCFFYAIYGI